MGTKKALFLFTGIFLLLLSVPLSTARAEGKKKRVLFIGNSYTSTNSLPSMLQRISQAKKEIDCVMYARGGASLESHWKEGIAQKKIREGEWDYVVLQDQSRMPCVNPESALEYGGRFCRLAGGKGVKPVFFMTWAYKRGDREKMQKELAETYCLAARRGKALVAPVGLAWMKTLKKDPDLELFRRDGSHPSARGTYLAACVFYATITGTSPVGLPLECSGPKGNRLVSMKIPKKEGLFLQKTAWETVRDFQRKKTIEKTAACFEKEEAARPSVEEAKAGLRKNISLNRVLELLGDPLRREEGDRTILVYELKGRKSLRLVLSGSRGLVQAAILREDGSRLELDLP